MNLICAVKFVLDIGQQVQTPSEPGVMAQSRDELCRVQINTDDMGALGYALQVKKTNPDTHIELVTVGPHYVGPHLKDILRVGVDQATLITHADLDEMDALMTAQILARYLGGTACDCLLTGTRAIDDGSGLVPAYLAELLGLDHMSGISKIEWAHKDHSAVVVTAQDKEYIDTYQIPLPAALSLTDRSDYRLPYVRLKDKNKDVSDQFSQLDIKQLGFEMDELAAKSIPVQYRPSDRRDRRTTSPLIVNADDHGVETVFTFLKDHRFI